MKNFCSVIQIFFVFLCLSAESSAQSAVTLCGTVRSAGTQQNLPFAKVFIEEGENHAFTQVNGSFRLEVPLPACLTFSAPLHRTITLSFTAPSDTCVNVWLPKHQVFVYETETPTATQTLIERAIANKSIFNPALEGQFQYKTYNKLTLNSGNTAKVRNLFQRAADMFDFVSRRLQTLTDSQHLLLSESVTERQYLNALNQQETILNARFTSIENPTVLTMNSAIQPLTLYETRVNIAGKAYYSPFMPNALKWYYFRVVDTTYVQNDTIYTVKFNPWWKKRIAFLKGYLYIAQSDFSLRGVWVSPATESKAQISFAQTYRQYGQVYFPAQTQTGVYQQAYGSGQLSLNAESTSLVFGVQQQQAFRKRNFDEVVLNFQRDTPVLPEAYWKSLRQGTFTPKDSLTYVFYDSVGTIPNFDRVIRLGESIYYGELPLGGFNITLNKLLNYNQFEGLRVGFGARTNELLSRVVSVGGYVGFGLRDGILKFGGNADFTLYRPADAVFKITAKHDVEEAGGIPLAFAEKQYSSESVRNLRLSMMDLVSEQAARLQFRLLKNVQLEGGFALRHIEPQYAYTFNDAPLASFQANEIRLAMRYAYGERYLQSLFRKISLGTDYPLFWIQYRKGSQRLGSDFTFNRLDLQVRESFRMLGLGTGSVQLSAGWVEGNVPYSLLYNGKGSYRPFAAIAHNSFETMNYNEFLSDRYIALFYAHNFGKIYIRRFKKQPSIEMLHNMGFGTLQHVAAHQEISLRTMERGFFESGLFLNNILVVKVPGLQTGIGAGAFIRYGPYAYENLYNNILFKFAVDFQL